MTRVALFGVGSTNFRYAAATPSGKFSAEPTVESTQPEDVAQQIVAGIDDLQSSETGDIDAVAVSAPGLVDRDRGAILNLDAPDG
jgi:glucokinase